MRYLGRHEPARQTRVGPEEEQEVARFLPAVIPPGQPPGHHMQGGLEVSVVVDHVAVGRNTVEQSVTCSGTPISLSLSLSPAPDPGGDDAVAAPLQP